MATSGEIYTNYVGNMRLRYYWELSDNRINWWLTAEKGDSNYRTLWYYSVDKSGSNIAYSNTHRNIYNGDTIDSGSFEATNSFSIYVSAGIGQASENATAYGEWDVPRYATISVSVTQITVNSIKINWSTDANVDQFQYRLNGGSWVDAERNINKSSGSFIISNLTPNTSYDISFDAKRTDSQQWSTWGGKEASLKSKTLQIASVMTIDFNLGSSAVMAITRPEDGSVVKVAIYNSDGSVLIAPYKEVNVGSIAFYYSFTDEEKDKIYKMFGTGTEVNLRVYVSTTLNGQTYYTYRSIKCYLSGNQKTGHINVNGSWRRTKKWVNVNGSWKRCLRWVNVNGVWKRCI